MAALAHRVRRMKWHVKTRSERQAFALRTTLRTQMEEVLLPAFARAFDRIAPDDDIVRIPHLELGLRIGGVEQLAAALGDAVERHLRAYPPVSARSASMEWREVLIGYLMTGTIAWQAAPSDPRDMVAQLQATLRARLEHIVRIVQAGSQSFDQRLIVYFRILRLLPASQWPDVADVAWAGETPSRTASHATAAREAIAEIAREGRDPQAAMQTRLAALILAVADSVTAEEPDVRRELAGIIGDSDGVHDVLVAGAVQKDLPKPVTAFLFSRILTGQLFDQPDDMQKKKVRSRTGVKFLPPKRTQTVAGPAVPVTAAAFVLTVQNAGLVLLHPFLPSLFAHCGLLESGRLLRLERAAALLAWLATGLDSAQEFELGFVKVLLGMRPEQPLAVDPGLLTAADREEGEAVLCSVLSHWKALGGTSVEGLRVSFLQREGFLRDEDDGWKLQPETEAFDVLIARLPWGIGMMRLPWMTRPLFTDWPTP